MVITTNIIIIPTTTVATVVVPTTTRVAIIITPTRTLLLIRLELVGVVTRIMYTSQRSPATAHTHSRPRPTRAHSRRQRLCGQMLGRMRHRVPVGCRWSRSHGASAEDRRLGAQQFKGRATATSAAAARRRQVARADRILVRVVVQRFVLVLRLHFVRVAAVQPRPVQCRRSAQLGQRRRRVSVRRTARGGCARRHVRRLYLLLLLRLVLL